MPRQLYVWGLMLLVFFFSPLPAFAATWDISYTSSGFSPATVTIAPGDTVRWTNSSSDYVELASDPHPVHTNYPALNLGVIAVGSSATFTFTTTGSYGFHNHLNSNQTGSVLVQAAASPAPSVTPASSPVPVSPSPVTTIPVTGSYLPTVLFPGLALILIFGGGFYLLK